MRQGAWFVVLFFSCGSVALTLIQPKPSITAPVGESVRVRCQVNGGSVSNSNPLHWYQQKPGKPLERILHYGDSVTRDSGFGTSFSAAKITDSNLYLSIKVNADSAATYYCAYWGTSGTWRKIFGGGTRLFVTNRGIKPPKMHLLPPDREEEKNDKFFVACLMTDFFPEVIKVNWEVTGRTDLKILTEPVQEKNGNYSLISRLEVSRVEWEEQTVTCLMTHEALTDKLTTSAQRRADQKITPNLGEVTCPSEESRETRNEETPYTSLWVATLTYTALLTKSVLYCFFISIVVYKMESRGAKKPM